MNLQISSRLRWQCRRGLLELDIILFSFLEKGYLSLSREDKESFTKLLSRNDPELNDWLIFGYPCDCLDLKKIVDIIRQDKD